MRLCRHALIPLIALVCAGCQTQSAQMGHASFSAVTAIRDVKPSSAPMTIQGTMIEKCPMSGCWFKVQDGSGVLKVDTKAAGFVVVDVPVGSQVTVSGTFQATPEPEMLATGLRY